MKIFGIQFGQVPPKPELPRRGVVAYGKVNGVIQLEEERQEFLRAAQAIGLNSGAVRSETLRRVLFEEKIPIYDHDEVLSYLEAFEKKREGVVCRPLRRCDAQARILMAKGSLYSSLEPEKFPRWNDDVPLEALRIVKSLEDKLARPDDVTDAELRLIYDKRYKEACDEANSGKLPVLQPLHEAVRAVFQFGYEFKRKDDKAHWVFFVVVAPEPSHVFLAVATVGTALTFLTSWDPKDYE